MALRTRVRSWSLYALEVLVLLTLFGAVSSYVYAQQEQPFSLTLVGANCTYTNYAVTGQGTASGSVMLGGGYSQQIHFEGNLTMTVRTRAGVGGPQLFNSSFTIAGNSFNPSSLQYPSQTAANFSYTTSLGVGSVFGVDVTYCAITIRALDPSGNVVATATLTPQSSTGLTSDFLLRYLITLPTIPSSLFGIQGGQWPNGYGGQYGFDVLAGGAIFQTLFYVGILGLVVTTMVALLFMGFGAFSGEGGSMLKLFTSSIFAFFAMAVMLPLYNILAVGFNSLSYWIISPDAPTYNGAVSTLNGLMLKGFGPPDSTIWKFLQDPLAGTVNGIAQTVMYVLYLILVPILGVARIFLIVAFVAMGPIIIILSLIPLTRHIAQQLFSTVIGLMLAAPVAAVFIRLGFVILSGLEPNANLLIPGGGFFTFLIVAASVFGAAFIPMVLAPLTGFFFQTLSQMGMTAAATGVLAGSLGVGGAALPAGSAFVTGAKGAAAGGAGLLGQVKAGFGNIGKSLPTITKDAASNMGLMMVTGVGSLTGATQMTKQLGYAGWRLKAPTNTATKVKASLVTGGGPAAVMGNVDGLLDPGILSTANPTNSAFQHTYSQLKEEGLDKDGIPTDPLVASYLVAGSKGTMKRDEATRLTPYVNDRERRGLGEHLKANPADHVKLLALTNPSLVRDAGWRGSVVSSRESAMNSLFNSAVNPQSSHQGVEDSIRNRIGSEYIDPESVTIKDGQETPEFTSVRDWTNTIHSGNTQRVIGEMIDHGVLTRDFSDPRMQKMIGPRVSEMQSRLGNLYDVMRDDATPTSERQAAAQAAARLKNHINYIKRLTNP